MKKISILGSTGSIGTQTLEIIRKNPEEFSVKALVGNSNIELLLAQAEEFNAEYVGTSSSKLYPELRARARCKVLPPETALTDAIEVGPDVSVIACSGINGLKPVMLALERGVDACVANKEALVTGGALVTEARKRSKANLFPVDSEHSAVWQSLGMNRKEDVDKIILTASGGAFRNLSREEISRAKASDALRHPNWTMGKKITLDCATLMNKGLEIIEAMYLFEVPADRISVTVHPESIVHSMVSYSDGAVMAEMSNPSMLIPISYALTYPERLGTGVRPLDFTSLGTLTFREVDRERFPCIKIAEEVARSHPSRAICMNAYNDVLIDMYMRDMIGFYDVSQGIEEGLDSFIEREISSIEDVIALDAELRAKLSKKYKL